MSPLICADIYITAIKTFIFTQYAWIVPIVYTVSGNLHDYKPEIIAAARHANKILHQDFIFLNFKDVIRTCNNDEISEVCVEDRNYFIKGYYTSSGAINFMAANGFWGNSESDIIFISDKLNYQNKEIFQQTLTHEFLHTYGFRHIKDSIMNETPIIQLDEYNRFVSAKAYGHPIQELMWMCYFGNRIGNKKTKFQRKQRYYRKEYGTKTNNCNKENFDLRFCLDI